MALKSLQSIPRRARVLNALLTFQYTPPPPPPSGPELRQVLRGECKWLLRSSPSALLAAGDQSSAHIRLLSPRARTEMVVMTTRQVTVPILDASVSRGVTGYLSGD